MAAVRSAWWVGLVGSRPRAGSSLDGVMEFPARPGSDAVTSGGRNPTPTATFTPTAAECPHPVLRGSPAIPVPAAGSGRGGGHAQEPHPRP